MNTFFSEFGIRAMDFVQISSGFLLTMLVFFSVKERKHFWLNYSLLITSGLQCIFFILFHDGNVRLFAALMLMSTLVVEGIITRRKKTQV
jgi:uncharacterized membrane protein YhfC